jgi:Ca2+-transporting ATPase
MGKIGTDVAKEASDIVLLDDNFGSIVGAIEEGKNIYATIRKVVLYLFSTGLGELLTLAGGLLVAVFVEDFPLPLLAAQILWLNLVTDGFLTVAMAAEPREEELLTAPPSVGRTLVDRRMLQRIVVMGLPMAIGALTLFAATYPGDLRKGWTMTLTALAFFQWFNAWNCRSATKSVFAMNPFSNRYLVYAALVVVALQILAVYHPVLQAVLRTTALTFSEWLLAIGLALTVVLAEEFRKAAIGRG